MDLSLNSDMPHLDGGTYPQTLTIAKFGVMDICNAFSGLFRSNGQM